MGTVVLGTDKRLRVALAANYQRLEFLRVLRSHDLTPITDPGSVVVEPPMQGPPRPPQSATEAGAGNG